MSNNLWTPYNINNGLVQDINKYNSLNFNTNNNIKNNTNNNIMNTNITNLSNIFFSNENMEYLQEQIIIQVYNNSGYRIKKQNYDELKIIMRSYYLQFGKNSPNNIRDQLNDLNRMVIEWSINQIINNIKQQDIYIQTISTLPMPLERSQLPSQKGTRTLEIKSFI